MQSRPTPRPLRACLWLLHLSLALLLFGAMAPAAAPGGVRPNVLVLVADDQRWDQLSCADQPVIPQLRTPHIDALARQGVFFRNAFVTTPICSVSRASIMTGRYATTHGMNRFNTPLAGDVLAKTYPALFKQHGYRTGVLGKWGMGVAGTEKIFDHFQAWADQGRYFHETEHGRVHNAEWLAREARAFLASVPRDQPFCLTVCFKSPHHPYQPDPRDQHLFEEVRIPQRRTDTPEAYRALPAHVFEGSLNRWCYFDERKDEATRDRFEKDFLRCVVSLDRSVGQILQALRDLELDQNTIILYLSDNGYLWGEHGLGGKWVLFDESIRVPLIVRWPGQAAALRGERRDELVLNLDVAPTLLDLAGIPVPREMDGASLQPLLSGQTAPWREDFFLEHVGVVQASHPIPDSRGVRSADWKYIRYLNIEPEAEALYHLGEDPTESHNLAEDAKYAGVKQRLRQRYESHLASLRKEAGKTALAEARKSATLAGYSLSKVQRWLHEVALKQIDPETKLYISHSRGSGRYPKSLWNYDDAAADTYPFLFWAAWYTDFPQINGPVLEVLRAEQRLCNHLDRIPTAINHKTLEKDIKSKDDLIFAASEYVKDGLVAIVEVAGKDNPWFERMREIEDDIWKHADIETAYGPIPTNNLEANGEQLQVLARLFTMTGERKYLDWAERLADHYLLPGNFVPSRLRDHGCEIIGGLGLLLGVESEHNPEKARVYLPLIRKMLDEILARGTNEDGFMFDQIDRRGRLSDGWGYNYTTYLCHDTVAGEPTYRRRIEQTLRSLAKPTYRNYDWEGNIDGFADSIEGAIYLLNRLPVPEGLAWVDQEMAAHVTRAAEPLATAKLWTTYKLDSNAVRTVLMHAMMHTRGTVLRPWRQDLSLGASPTEDGLALVLKADQPWSGTLVIDKPRHRLEMGFQHDWPRMNTMPEWFTAEPEADYVIKDLQTGTTTTCTGAALHAGLAVTLEPGVEKQLLIRR